MTYSLHSQLIIIYGLCINTKTILRSTYQHRKHAISFACCMAWPISCERIKSMHAAAPNQFCMPHSLANQIHAALRGSVINALPEFSAASPL